VTQSRFDRRRLMAGSAGIAVLAGAASVAGCSDDKKSANTSAGNSAVALPSFKRFAGVKPDLPATDAGVTPGYFHYPKDRPAATSGKPGAGGLITAMVQLYVAPPQAPPKNKYWGELNSKLGLDLDLTMVPIADYPQKFQTTIAGNDLPDFLQLAAAPNTPGLLASKFADLTEFLSGDAVLEYPNLANIATRTWKPTVFNGGIYGIPIPREALGAAVFCRKDLYDAAGASTTPAAYDEFLEGCKALTDPSKRRWAYGQVGSMQSTVATMNGVPNGWRAEGGKLTNSIETPEYATTIGMMVDLWTSGVMHPDAFNAAAPFKQWFSGGTIATAYDGYLAWSQYYTDGKATPGFAIDLMPVPKHDGGGLAPWWLGSGYYSVGAIKKAAPDRIKEILRVADWLAAPFGTAEHYFRTFGIEGVDFEVGPSGEPAQTPTGLVELTVPVGYIGGPPIPLYTPGRPESDVRIQHAYMEKEIPVGISNPVVGLYSDTDASKGATASKNFTDAVNEIIQGRKPLSGLGDLISTWRTASGDKARSEFESQFQAAGGPSATPT
jgi:putative aldouronate transport system substrate-binding protein